MGTTYENSCVMNFKDSSSNLYKMYPVTKKSNVIGIDEAIRDQGVVTSGNGSTYTATVEGISSLSAGVGFVMVPHVVSTTTAPKLNVNGLGAKNLRRRVSSSTGTTTSGLTNDWLTANKPVTVVYDGTFWIVDLPRPNATDIMGTVAITNGGTGANNAADARVNLGIETSDGTVTSGNADYAEVGEWVDSNSSNEDRIGYFVCIDNTTAGTTMRKATNSDDVRGVTVSAPAFAEGCTEDKYDSNGNLIAKYDYVAVMGIVSVIDDGTCVVNNRCMPNANGVATKVTGDYGYHVVSRVDSTHVLIALEPGTDFQYKLSAEVAGKASQSTVNSVANTANAALPKSGGTMTGSIAMGSNRITGLGTPTASTDATTKAYVDGKRLTKTASITTSWTGSAAPYTQSVTVSGILATDFPHITPVYSSTLATAIAQKEAWSMVSKGEPGAEKITFTCFEDKPTVSIPIQIEVMR